jgi:hypothetical protein
VIAWGFRNGKAASIEAVVQPDRVTDKVRRESGALIGMRRLILPISASYLGDTEIRSLLDAVY